MEVILPDKRQCKTRCLNDELWECLVENSLVCPFNINAGGEFFCMHHDSKEYADAGKK